MRSSVVSHSTGRGPSISFRDVSVSVPNGLNGGSRLVVDGASGNIRCSSLCAILGSSGAGKSSFLNALAQRNTAVVTGTVLINGQCADRDFYIGHTAFITQQSVLLPALTPREAFVFSSAIRLHHSVGHNTHVANAEAIITALSLERCADSRIGDELIGGLSGGERRRVAVGIELVTRPHVLYADEPMTGLDSQTALTLTQSLKRITRSSPSVTVITTVHQPSHDMFALFDDLIIMAHGKLVYCGAASAAVTYMSGIGLICPIHTNPPEWLLDLIQGTTDDDHHRFDLMEQHYQQHYIKDIAESLDQAAGDNPLSSNSVPSQLLPTTVSYQPYAHELYYLIQRAHINVTRQPLLRAAQVLQSVVLGLLVGLGFLSLSDTALGIQNRLGCIYFILLSVIFANCFAVVLTFAEERAVFLREQSNAAYRVSSYFVAKTAVELIPNVTCSVLFAVIAYFLVDFQQSTNHFAIFTAVIICIGLIGAAMGLIVASSVRSRLHAMMMTPLVIAPFIIFTPYALPFNNCPLYFIWLQYLSPFWWSFSILAANEFNQLPLTCVPSERIVVPPVFGYDLGSVCFFTRGNQVLDHFDISDDVGHMQMWFVALVVQAIGYRIVAFILLTKSARRAAI